MLRTVALKLGRRLKGDVFDIDEDVDGAAILSFGMQRLTMALRGLVIAPFLRSFAAPIFVGRGTRLTTRKRIRIGRGATIGEFVRMDGLSKQGIEIGPGATIGAYTVIMPTSVLRRLGVGFRMGRNSGIGQFSFVGCGGGVTVGDNVIMGQYVSFHTQNHIFSDVDATILSQGVTHAPIVIEDDCWIGAKATFLSGAKVDRGCVVAAGAVVRGEIPPYSVIGGVPARILKSRVPSG